MNGDDLADADAVAGIDLMSGLSASALRDATASARVRAVEANRRIFDQGEPAERAHALLSGGVRISQSGSDGEEILIRFISPGEIFGCATICTDQLYPADATAIVDSVEVSWDQKELLCLMERHSQIAINMIAVIGRRLGVVQERVRELATQTAERRVAHTLLRLFRQSARPHEKGHEILFPLRRKDVADIAGTTLHTASRILAEWERKGLLISRNQHLILCAPSRIEAIAEDAAA